MKYKIVQILLILNEKVKLEELAEPNASGCLLANLAA